jgi:hypothetical protein
VRGEGLSWSPWAGAAVGGIGAAVGGIGAAVGGTGVAIGAAGVQAAKSITPNAKIILRANRLLWFMVSSCIYSRLLRATCTIRAEEACIENFNEVFSMPLNKVPKQL